MDSAQPNSPRDRPSGSFLVRLWREPGSGAALRCFVKNLRTGAEQYLTGSDDLVRILALQVEMEVARDEAVEGGAA
jgi:hypothetical protein